MRKLGIITYMLLLANVTFSQTILSNSRPSVEWKQIDTERFKLIFSSEFEGHAHHIASLMDTLYTVGASTMHEGSPRKISLIMRDRNSISNGFVALGPKRSEIFTMPSQNYNFIGTNDWLEKVTIHEYRHVVQFDHSRRGVSNLAYNIFGENTLSVLAFMSAPQWYWEGDAVALETALTPSGRGRIPAFNKLLRTNVLEGNKFSYNKQFLRSYKDNIPNHYVLGAHFIPYLRTVTDDPEIWEKITAKTFAMPLKPFAFSSAMKKYTGKNLKTQYSEMMDHLEENWKEELSKVEVSEFDEISELHKVYTDYLNPVTLEDGTIIAQKEGLGDIQRFVRIDENGIEKHVFLPGIMNNTGMLSYGGGKIAWTEYNFDPRWRAETHSVLKFFDLETRRASQLAYKTRFVGADLNSDGSRVVTTETNEAYQHSIVLLNSDGTELKRFRTAENHLFSHVRFANEEELIAVRRSGAGKALVAIDIQSGEFQILMEDSDENIGNPVAMGDYVFFSSPYSGIDNIYVYDANASQVFKVTSSKYGAFSPMPSDDGEWLYYNEHRLNGMQVVRVPVDPDSWEPRNQTEVHNDPLFKATIHQEDNSELLDNLVDKEYQVVPYKKSTGLLNPHSWGPFVNTSFDEVDLGIFSRDIMSTLSLYGGYNYDLDEEVGTFVTRLSYQGLYPIIDLEYNRGNRSVSTSLSNQALGFNWKEDVISGQVRLPFILTHSKFRTNLNFTLNYSLTKISNFNNTLDDGGRTVTIGSDRFTFWTLADQGNVDALSAKMSFFNYMKMSRRDVQPRWGQHLIMEQLGTLSDNYSGSRFITRTGLFFPGIGKHHSLNGFWEYQRRGLTFESDNYLFGQGIRSPRGLTTSIFLRDLYSMGVNYEMPILYPDLAIGPLVYIKRLKLNLYYDYAFGSSSIAAANYFVSREYNSTGAELRFDFNAGRFLVDIEMGVRYSYDINNSTGIFEIIFPSIDL